jgi:hypothetical protein
VTATIRVSQEAGHLNKRAGYRFAMPRSFLFVYGQPVNALPIQPSTLHHFSEKQLYRLYIAIMDEA